MIITSCCSCFLGSSLSPSRSSAEDFLATSPKRARSRTHNSPGLPPAISVGFPPPPPFSFSSPSLPLHCWGGVEREKEREREKIPSSRLPPPSLSCWRDRAVYTGAGTDARGSDFISLFSVFTHKEIARGRTRRVGASRGRRWRWSVFLRESRKRTRSARFCAAPRAQRPERLLKIRGHLWIHIHIQESTRLLRGRAQHDAHGTPSSSSPLPQLHADREAFAGAPFSKASLYVWDAFGCRASRRLTLQRRASWRSVERRNALGESVRARISSPFLYYIFLKVRNFLKYYSFTS